jgi:sodium-dependent dicarboxylate transporter 2/3/5
MPWAKKKNWWENKYLPYIKKRNNGFLLLAFLSLILVIFLPTPQGLTENGQVMIGIFVMAAILWITEALPLAVTGLLVMAIQSLLHIIKSGEVFSALGNEAIFFLLGAFMIAVAVEKHGFHRRIAFNFLKIFEESPKVFTFGLMFSCAFLSFIIPEHAVAALFLPIGLSILTGMKLLPGESNFGKVCMLSIAYGCSIGSLGTLIGGARNPLTVGILENHGISVSFFDWMVYSMPVVFISLPVVWLILQYFFPIEVKDLKNAKKEIDVQLNKLGKMGIREKTTIIILSFTMFLWIFFSQDMGMAIIAITGATLLFVTRTITWKDVEQSLPWGIILLYGGAITLGLGMETTGAARWIADGVLTALGENPYIIILGLIILSKYLTEMMSNTGAVAMLLPIGIGFAGKIADVSILLASMIIALSSGLAFMLVIATPGNAITYTSGYFSTRDLARAGLMANIVCIVIIWVIAIGYWKGILGM